MIEILKKNRDTEMQKHDRAWPFCWARETATSATFYVGIYDRHTYAVVTSPQWSSNSQAGSAYDTVVWHWKILEMDAQFLQSYCMLLWNALMPAIFRHTQDISRWPWTTTIENKLLLQRRLCVFLTIFFCQLNSLRMTQTFRLKKWSISNYKTHRRAQAR